MEVGREGVETGVRGEGGEMMEETSGSEEAASIARPGEWPGPRPCSEPGVSWQVVSVAAQLSSCAPESSCPGVAAGQTARRRCPATRG